MGNLSICDPGLWHVQQGSYGFFLYQYQKGRLHYVMSLGDMLHERGQTSPNVHAAKWIYIFKYCHCHWESIEMYNRYVTYILCDL